MKMLPFTIFRANEEKGNQKITEGYKNSKSPYFILGKYT